MTALRARTFFVILTALFAAHVIMQPLSAVVAKKKRRPLNKPIKANPRTTARITHDLQTSKIGIENPAALVPFFERLRRGLPISILHYGDSHTAADVWTGELRRLFQARFGNGGAGFSHAGRPWNTYRREDIQSRASKRWYTYGLVGREGDGRYGLSGTAIETDRAGEWITLQADGSHLELWYLRQPGGGSFDIAIDNQPAETISTDGDAGPAYFEKDLDEGLHQIRVETTSGSPVRLFGWVTGRKPGVTYEMLGINGAQAAMILNWSLDVLTDHIARRDPGLIVLAYGTNEASNATLSEESYREVLVEAIGRLRNAAPAASILLIGPPDRAHRQRRKWLTYQQVDRIVSAERAAAKMTGCAFYDLRGKMGNKGVMHDWVLAGLAQKDHVHLTGTGYRLIAGALYADVTALYDEFLKTQDQNPPQK